MGKTVSKRNKYFFAVVIIALTIRLFHLCSLQNDPVADILVLDSQSYASMAKDIAEGRGMPREVFFQAPLYPYFLGLVFKLTGDLSWSAQLNTIRVIQIMFDSLSAGFVMLIALELFGVFPAIISGLGMAFYPVLIFQTGLILKTTLNIFFTVLIIFLIFGLQRLNHSARSLACGVTTGFAAAAQGSVLLQFPIILLGCMWRAGLFKWRKSIPVGVICVIGFLAAVSPFTIRNYLVSGEFVLLTAQGGANFYLGNSPYSDGTSKRPPWVRMTPEHEQADFHREAERATGRKLTPKEASSYWFNAGIQWMKENPGDAFKLQLRKLGLFWNRVEIPDNYDFDFYRRYSPWISFPRYPFQFVCLAGILGMIFCWKRWRELWFLYAMCLTYAAIWITFHIYSRYRLPVVVYLWLFAGVGLVWSVKAFRELRWGRIAIVTVVSLFIGYFTALPLTSYSHAQSYFNLGSGLTRLGKIDNALAAYQKALDLQPDYSPALVNMGKIYYQTRNLQRALEIWERAEVVDPASEELQNNLGTISVQMNQLENAEYHFRRSVEIQPYYFLGWLHLAQVMQIEDRHDEAVIFFKQALGLEESDPQALYGLAKSFDKLGDWRDALDTWKHYLEIARNHVSEKQYILEAKDRIRLLEGNQKNDSERDQ